MPERELNLQPEIVETLPVPRESHPSDITVMISRAIELGATVDVMERLAALHERLTKEDARKAFIVALNAFQAECPVIPRNGRNKGITHAGAKEGVPYARLEEDILPTIQPVLRECGLSYRFDSDREGDLISATAFIAHTAGHIEKSTFTGELDDRANRATSRSQKGGAALTYARRMALIMALGLRTGEKDDDGLGTKPGMPISDPQFDELNKELTETKTDMKLFLKHFHISDLSEMTTEDLERAEDMLERKKRQQ